MPGAAGFPNGTRKGQKHRVSEKKQGVAEALGSPFFFVRATEHRAMKPAVEGALWTRRHGVHAMIHP